jgi:hypothetical protein
MKVKNASLANQVHQALAVHQVNVVAMVSQVTKE